jgi:uncharacterized repeat protein (TIGR02543 family)
VAEGERLTAPTAPTKDGFTFECWTFNGNEWDFANNTVTSDIILVAKWTENKAPETDDTDIVNDPFAALDKTGCPEILLGLNEYIASTKPRPYCAAITTR